MPTLYLIAHKVRGEPAFDVAACEAVDGEEHWIIPTSGHRAYPYWNIALDAIEFEGDGNYYLTSELSKMPDDLPDHYTTRAAPKAAPLDISATLRALGLAKPTNFTRRF